jgi:hypothetical protein
MAIFTEHATYDSDIVSIVVTIVANLEWCLL